MHEICVAFRWYYMDEIWKILYILNLNLFPLGIDSLYSVPRDSLNLFCISLLSSNASGFEEIYSMYLFMPHQHNVRKLITELLGVAVLSLDKCCSKVSLHPQQSHQYKLFSLCMCLDHRGS